MNLKTFRLVGIITVIVVLLLGVLSLFNQQAIICSLYGYQYKTVMAMIMFWSFLGGILFAGAIGIILFVESGKKHKTLKKEVKEMKEIHEEE